MIQKIAAAVQRVDDPGIRAAIVNKACFFSEQVVRRAMLAQQVNDDLVGLVIIRRGDFF